jgi:hypothetical protein
MGGLRWRIKREKDAVELKQTIDEFVEAGAHLAVQQRSRPSGGSTEARTRCDL